MPHVKALFHLYTFYNWKYVFIIMDLRKNRHEMYIELSNYRRCYGVSNNEIYKKLCIYAFFQND